MATRNSQNRFSRYFASHRLKFSRQLLIGCGVALLLCLLLVSAQGSSSTHSSTIHPKQVQSTVSGVPTMDVEVGFNSMYRVGYWTPVYVNMSSGRNSFTGKISISVVTQAARSSINTASPWSFDQPLTLAKNSKKQLTLSVPFYAGDNVLIGVVAKLWNNKGKVVSSQTVTSGNEVLPGSLFVGTLADNNANFDPISRVYLPTLARPIILSALDSRSMPTTEALLENFDMLILDDYTSRTLNADQLLALQTWVNRGGILIEAGGPSWQRTLGSLPDNMVPVTVHGMRTLPAGTRLVSLNEPLLQDDEQQPLTDTLPTDVIASVATLRTQSAFSGNEAVLSVGTIPLMVRARQGQGSIYYLAVDPASDEMANWDGDSALWRTIFTHALGDSLLIFSPQESYNTGPGQMLTRAGLINMLTPDNLPGPSVILVLLFGYALILGPIRLYMVKRKRWQRWNWPIILCTIALFTLISYELTTYQRNASIVDNSISLVDVNQGGNSAHITTYSGIYVPNSGDFTMHVPGNSVIEPIANQYMLQNRGQLHKRDIRATSAESTKETNLTLQGLGTWTLHHTIDEQDTRLPGGITSHLYLNKNRLQGTIKNGTNNSLSDVYVLFPHQFVSLGDLGAGEERQVNLALSGAQAPPWTPIADQLAENAGLPSSYYPYAQKQQPQTNTQRHMALLSALNGAGFTYPPCKGSCKTNGIMSRNTIFVTGGRVPNPNMNDYDPLLVDNAPATLIGWANGSMTDNVTINGWQPIGRHESLMRMPLNIDISSPLNTPPEFIAGHVVGIQSADADLRLAGIYALTQGSLTFEMTLPDSGYTHFRNLTVTAPDLWAHPFGPGTGLLSSHLQVLLYNWNKGAWDTVPLTQDSFTTTDTQAYVGPSNRILVQVTNKDFSLGSLYFGTPYLSVN